MYVKEVTVENQVGLHARPATFFIQKANEFKSSIWVEKEERRVNAKSLLRRLWAAFFSPVGVSAWTASSVSAPRLFHWASALHWGANSATAAASRPCGAPYRRSTQRVSSAKSHQPLIFDFYRTNTSSSAASASSSDCWAVVRTCVPAGTLPCARRSASSSAACAARARTSARSGRETKSFLT